MSELSEHDEIERLRETVATLKMQVQSLEQGMQYVDSGQEHFLGMFYAASTPLYVKNDRCQWVFVNDALCRLLGVSRGEILGNSDWDLFGPESAGISRERDKQVLQSGQSSCALDEHYFNGAARKLRTLRNRYHDRDSGETFLLCIVQEIPGSALDVDDWQQQKAHLEGMLQTCSRHLARANEALDKESNRRQRAEQLLEGLQQSFRSGPVVLLRWQAAPGWPVEFVSDSIRQFGFQPAYFHVRTAYRPLIHPLDVSQVEARLEAFAYSKDPVCEQRYRLIDSDGKIRWIYDFRTLERDVRGKVTHHQGYIIDFTEQNRTAGALQHIEARFGSLAGMLPYSVMEIDAAGTILSANAACANLLDYTVDELEHQCLWSLLAEDMAQQHLSEQFARLRSAGGSYQTLLLRKDRVPVHVQLDWNAMHNSHGKIGGYVMVMADINRWQQLVASLEESGARFQHIIDSAPVMIWMAGTGQHMTYLNRTWLEFTGLSLENALGLGWAAQIHPDDRAACESAYQDAFSRRQTLHLNYRLRRHDGAYRWLDVNAVPYLNAERHFTGYIGACTDITPMKRSQAHAEQEAHTLNLLFQSLGLALLIVKADATCVTLNALALDSLGLGREVVGQSLFGQLPELSAHHFQNVIAAAIAEGRAQQPAGADLPALQAMRLGDSGLFGITWQSA